MSSRAPKLYDRNFLIAFLGQTLFVTGNSLLIHYSRWVDFLGGDERDIGLVMGTAPILSLLIRPWMGQSIDRIGARSASIAGALVVLVSTAMNLFLQDLGWGVYLSRTGMVVGGAVFFASSITYITQTTPVERRTEAIGILGCGGFLGMVFGPLIGDLLLPDGGQRTRHDFQCLFVVVAVSIAFSILLLASMRTCERRRTAQTWDCGQFFRMARQHSPGAVLWVNAIFGVGMCLPFVFLSKYVDDAGIKGLGVGAYFAVYAGWGLTLRLSMRRLPDRLGRRRILALGLAIMALGSFCYPLISADCPWWLVVCAFLSGTAHSLMFHTMMALTLETFPIERHGTGTVLAYMCLDLGMIAVAPLLGYIVHFFGYPAMYRFVGASALVVLACYAVAESRFNRRRAMPATSEKVRCGRPTEAPS